LGLTEGYEMKKMGRPRRVMLILAALSLFCIAAPVLAHAPLLPGNNEDLGSATFIPDPTKSWALYGELHEGGEAQYYRFDIRQGERIHVSLFTTASSEDETFLPGLILMGPGIPEMDTAPPYVETLPHAGLLAMQGSRAAEATFEGFSPGVFVELAEISQEAPADGTYYIVVYSSVRGGHYGLAVGDREAFTLSEWILIPFSLLAIYLWERQNLLVILAPAITVFIVGIAMILRRGRRNLPLDMPGWSASVAGLLFLATGATVFSQLLFALSYSSPDSFVIVTILLGIIPVILGIATLRLAFRHSGHWTAGSQAWLFILAVLAIAAWSGYLIGPILAAVAGIIPSLRKMS
jgi:membrane protein CcdC involved in cytochrome C biogenesis